MGGEFRSSGEESRADGLLFRAHVAQDTLGSWGAHSMGRGVVLEFWRVWEVTNLFHSDQPVSSDGSSTSERTWRGRKQANRRPAAYNFPLSLKAQMPLGPASLFYFLSSGPRC